MDYPSYRAYIGDSLSHLDDLLQQGQCLEEKVDLYIQTVFTSLAVSNTQLERIREKQEEGEVCRALKV